MPGDHDPAGESRCEEAQRFQRIDAAFRAGDLDALRAALDDPAAVPNGRMPDTIGSCLVYAIYHSPLPFVRTLLEMGADPNGGEGDGFPPLIAALACTSSAPGATARRDVDGILRLLLSSGADPNLRGINDYTPLHMAVAERNLHAIQILLDAKADPTLRTRIDDCETPAEMARAAGFEAAEALLRRRGLALRTPMRPGLVMLFDAPGSGDPVRRHQVCRLRLRLWLREGQALRWDVSNGTGDRAVLEDDGETLVSDLRVNRRSMIGGLFYGIEGMRVGGTRRLEIAPHLAYADRGVPGMIPPGAALVAEVTILEARSP